MQNERRGTARTQYTAHGRVGTQHTEQRENERSLLGINSEGKTELRRMLLEPLKNVANMSW